MQIVTMGDIFIPTSLDMGSSGKHVWLVTGASNLPSLDSASLACVKVVCAFGDSLLYLYVVVGTFRDYLWFFCCLFVDML
ncbi:hypothetical protein GIB67_020391 [Kingdonia uniflora]|uniref:Uncharacterized protein n=1 Tax=Kingdonia uniflora TaxID=39325 RepID=A0A7J7LBV1_9MAGN|nr:hypothetical protein GIB67_020391 [Kingdonia uniflora]